MCLAHVSRLAIASIVLAFVTSARADADLPFADLPGSGDCHPAAIPEWGPAAPPRTTLPSHPTMLVDGPRASLSFESRDHGIVPYRVVETQGDLARVVVGLDDGPLELRIRRYGGETYRACYRVSRSLSLTHRARATEMLVTDRGIGLRLDSTAELAVVEWSDGRRQMSWPDLVSLERATPNGPLGYRVVAVFADGSETTALQSIYYRAEAPRPSRIPWRGLMLLLTGAIVIGVARSMKPRFAVKPAAFGPRR